MPRFLYKAKNGPEKLVQGSIIADSQASALTKIESLGYTPVSIQEEGFDSERGDTGRGGRIRREDVTVFTRQLGGLLRAGVPILKALRTVREQSMKRRFRLLVAWVEDSVRDGNRLSDALAAHTDVFSGLYISMVRAGESAGSLVETLFRLAEGREQEEETRRKVATALAYPTLVFVVGFLTVFVLVTFFLPRIADLFRSYSDLPWATGALITISDFCSAYWKPAIVPLVLLLAILKRVTSGGKGREVIDAIKLRTPGVGRLVKESEVARFSRNLAMLLRAGVSIERALRLSADTMQNAVLRDEIESVRTKTVDQGMALAAGLRGTVFFPVFVRNMIAVGEESGRLEECLDDVALFYERQVGHRVRMATNLVEPLMILVVGAMVGFIVFAMLMPIFALTSSLG